MRKLRMPPTAYEMLQGKAEEGNYGKKFFSKFMNDLAHKDMYADPTKLSKRVTEALGRIYYIELTDESVTLLNDVAMSSGLVMEDPALIYCNIYTGYIEPVEWPDIFSAFTDYNLPIPEEALRYQQQFAKYNIPEFEVKPQSMKVTLTLSAAARTRFPNNTSINQLQGTLFMDTRPPDILEKHHSMEVLGLPITVTTETDKVPVQLRLETSTIEYLATIAAEYQISGSRRNTPNALAAATINAIAEGWLTPV